MAKELLFSVTKNDLVIETMRGTGPGGQNRNKRETCVRMTHPPSGAIGNCCDERSQLQNKRIAFNRLVKSPKFQAWVKREASAKLTGINEIENNVTRAMAKENIRVEIMGENGKWIEGETADDTQKG